MNFQPPEEDDPRDDDQRLQVGIGRGFVAPVFTMLDAINPGVSLLQAAMREGETKERYHARCVFETRVAELLSDAFSMGFRVTIENKSDTPPAMRHYHPVIHIYESRK